MSTLTANKSLEVDKLVEADLAFQTLSISTGTVNANLNSQFFYHAKVTLTEDITLNLQNAVNGGYGTIIIDQDATGGRTVTLPANSKVIGGSLSLASGANERTILTYLFDGTDFNWNFGGNYS